MTAIEIERAFENVSRARHFVAGRLREHSLDPQIVDDLELAASELVTNAIEHGGGARVVVEVEMTPVAVALTVTSDGPPAGVPEIGDWALSGADQTGGRGLGIVQAIADELYVLHGEHELAITMARRLT
jgi:anti-sigma regulatory factor (Ser/Thr protein kinase)